MWIFLKRKNTCQVYRNAFLLLIQAFITKERMLYYLNGQVSGTQNACKKQLWNCLSAIRFRGGLVRQVSCYTLLMRIPTSMATVLLYTPNGTLFRVYRKVRADKVKPGLTWERQEESLIASSAYQKWPTTNRWYGFFFKFEKEKKEKNIFFQPFIFFLRRGIWQKQECLKKRKEWNLKVPLQVVKFEKEKIETKITRTLKAATNKQKLQRDKG